jgi:hypothetical protein
LPHAPAWQNDDIGREHFCAAALSTTAPKISEAIARAAKENGLPIKFTPVHFYDFHHMVARRVLNIKRSRVPRRARIVLRLHFPKRSHPARLGAIFITGIETEQARTRSPRLIP